MKKIDGNKLAQEILDKIKQEISDRKIYPRLEIVNIGANFASEVYIEKKKNAASQVGIEVNVNFFDTISQEELEELITAFNENKEVHGIMIQLPIKNAEINKERIFEIIDPQKDVDGLSPVSLGRLWSGQESFVSATPLSILECLRFISIYEDQEYTSDEADSGKQDNKLKEFLSGKNILIINRSNILGKPLAAILSKYDATVTVAHSKSDLKTHSKNSDIIILGTGKSGLINSEMIKDEVILIDAGINETASGVGGDLNLELIDESKVSWITPVPGGVGPITVAMLMKNTLEAAKNLS
jgi:methylenetetrahydrofolate dehydrogenase (NADP+)/methenyltetrahydrofolate cyclohydrolase